MNSKGIFLTLMVFLVAIVAVSLAISNYNLEKQREVFSAEQTAFAKVNDQFETLYFEYKDLAAAGSNARYHSRVLPFEYGFSNAQATVAITQRVPGVSDQFSSFYDLLQTTSILWTNPRVSTGLLTELDFASLQNTAWLGTLDYPVINYRVLPGCIIYALDYENDSANKIVRFKKGSEATDGCTFDWPSIQKISIRITGEMDIDLQSDCTGVFANPTCFSQPFSENPNGPFVEFEYAGPLSSLRASNFLNAGDWQQPHTVSFFPAGDITGNPLLFEINKANGDLINLDLGSNTGQTRFLVETEITMRSPIQHMELMEFDLTVANPVFAIVRKTSGGN